MINGIIHSGQEIVGTNLFLHLDAAQLRSYPTTGTTWTDLSANGNTGTLTNGPTFDSNNGGSIVFDGANDYVTFNTYNFGNEMTIIGWIYPTYYTNNINTLYANSGGGGTTNGIRIFYNAYQTNSRQLIAEVGNGSTGTDIRTANNVITYDTWQQVVFVMNKNTTTHKIYHNGVFSVQKNITINYLVNASFWIGHIKASPWFPYKGRIGQWTVYNRELTATEITQNYNAIKSRYGL
jgi:hypothetical protein